MQRAAGNPLFLRELASVGEKTEDAEDLPDTVEELVATRIDQLAPGDRALLRWASVLGVSFSGALIVDVLEEDPNVAAASDAWDRLGEFVERDPDIPGGFRFRHALIRDAAYEGLSYKRRRELHGRVAEVLEQSHAERPDVAGLLSLHYFNAARWPETWRYSRMAGDRAAAVHANAEAAALLERALESARHIDVPRADLLEVAAALGEARLLLGQYEGATAAYGIARKYVDPEDPSSEARLVIKQMNVPLRLQQYPQVLRLLSRGLQLLENAQGETVSATRAELSAWYARTRILQHKPTDAVDWAQRAIAEADASSGRADEALGRAYLVLDLADIELGRESAEPYGERALEIFERIEYSRGVSATLDQLAARAYLAGRWDECLELAQRARDVDEKIGDSYAAAIGDTNIGELLADQGRPEQAEPIARRALEFWTTPGVDVSSWTTKAVRLLGYVLAQRGRFDDALAEFEKALDVARAADDPADELETQFRIAQCQLLQGDPDAASRLMDSVVAHVDGSRHPTLSAAMHRVWGLALLETGRLDEAEDALERSLAIARAAKPDQSIKSAEYELGLTFDALDRLARLKGNQGGTYAEQRDAVLERLGVVAIPDRPQARA
jgi:tetratricopeptide (TPR) repeat protein